MTYHDRVQERDDRCWLEEMHPENLEAAFDLMEKIKCSREPELTGNRLQRAAELSDILQQPGATHMMSDALEHLVQGSDRPIGQHRYAAVERRLRVE